MCEVGTRLQTFVRQTICSFCFYIPIVSVIILSLSPGFVQGLKVITPSFVSLYIFVSDSFDKKDSACADFAVTRQDFICHGGALESFLIGDY